MKKTYITFGQVHAHRVNGKTFDKDCVAVINHGDGECGRTIAFELFGPKFSMEYQESEWDSTKLEYFPRGYVVAQ